MEFLRRRLSQTPPYLISGNDMLYALSYGDNV